MNTEKSKPLLIGVAVICLTAAGFIMFRTSGGSSRSTEPVPMICRACGHTQEIPINDYITMTETQGNTMTSPDQLVRFECPRCSQRAMEAATRCVHCDTIFATDFQRDPQITCPNCNKSNIEWLR